MSTLRIFQLQLVLGYVACLLVFTMYIQPRLRKMDDVAVHRVMATIHSFRFFGLAFLVPGVVSASLPAGFASFAAYWDLATGALAMLALLTARVRPVFWTFVVAFNVVGIVDLVADYYHAMQLGVPAAAGLMGSMYIVPVLYVPMLMITHIASFYRLARRRGSETRHLATHAVLS
ncbi:MAG TPA: hypothetical protein VIM62_00105 [Acidobacteriaceae bacterium]